MESCNPYFPEHRDDQARCGIIVHRDAWKTVEIRGWSAVRAGDTVLRFSSRDDACRYLRGILTAARSIEPLRRLLAGEGEHALWRMEDAEVIERIAPRLVFGDLRMVECIDHPLTRTFVPDAGRSERSSRASSIVSTPSSLRTARTLVDEPPPTPSPAPPPDPFENVDHDLQAETLIAAARDGLPFCEKCRRRGRGRAGEPA